MASSRPDRRGSGHGHLDPTGDREVVFCHACSHEWYNDEYGLECPRCESPICEIITPDSDPRQNQSELHAPREHNHANGPDHDHDHDHPDPDEDDIAAAFPPHDFFGSPDMNRNRSNQNRPVDPNVFNRFQETLHMIGILQPPGQAGRPNRDLLGPSFSNTRTYNTPGGRATFSITTSTMGPRPGMHGGHHFEHADHNQEHNHNFDVIFGNVMGGGNGRAPEVGQGPFEGHLQNFLSIILGSGMGGINAVHGDAVYSQEHFDQIISQLMEAHPQSNAAPPATEDAIEKLEKKKLDKEMMGESGKAECTICIDDMTIGDEVTVLPCKHWFHGECVVLWLKEHNTCPICRSPIEKRDGNGENSDHAGGNPSAHPGTSPSGQTGGPRLGGWFGGGAGFQDAPSFSGGAQPFPAGDSAGPSASNSHNRAGRSIEERQARLNAIRSVGNPWMGQQAAPESPSSSRYRRDSWSPTSPPAGASSARERSPRRPRHDRTNSSSWSSQRSGRSGSNTNSGNNGGSSGPIHWLRDRFGSGGGGGGSGSGNDNGSNNGSGRRRS